ncbi:TetR/AcrR family transcriptional regulator [Azospirillum picis]|uniref:AcrR family transcriptional regulator n=1 Tax=Azospirillum picis TaxID=488438 RepID=A0ABU0MJA1_9PROT|nr:TetR/AcrR family transcriptional regulator [Azospirillum picis]MBP2299722.1 AcrR family transcriptional regulator [Azospirillum picis]MDQ0533518.1 AcrR family transcriptional regulator [Azospirillum picis]
MSQEFRRTQVRQPRADGERNRARIIEAAKQRFAEQGAGAALEQIARDAGVGIGTLYRHFPTRDVLIEAVYRHEVDALVVAAGELSAKEPPIEALRAWLALFIEFLDTKQGIGAVLDTLIGGSEPLYSGTPAQLSPPIDLLVSRANEDGAARIEIAPLDLLRAIAGVATIRPGAAWKRQALALVDLMLRGAQATV